MPIFNGTQFDICNGQEIITADHIHSISYPGPDDILLVSGTLVEGIGNIHSDLDIYVITKNSLNCETVDVEKHVAVCDHDDEIISPEDKGRTVYSTYDYYGDKGLHLDVKYVTYEYIYQLYEKIEGNYLQIKNDDKLYYAKIGNVLSKQDEKLIHRLQLGIPLSNSEQLKQLQSDSPIEQFCFCLHREFSPNYFVLKDVQGAWISGQLPMAKEIIRSMIYDHMRSITHLNLNSNKVSKWVFEYVNQLPDYADDLKSIFVSFMQKGTNTEEDYREYVLCGLDLMDMIFEIGIKLLENSDIFPSPDECARNLDIGMSMRNQGHHVLSQDAYNFRIKNFKDIGIPLRDFVLKGTSIS